MIHKTLFKDVMAGHSKWANIKHKKERIDAVKGQIFSRLTKEIISAVKQGGSDPKTNSKLRLVLQKAKAANLPNENIERNIKKAVSSDQEDFTELTYELYGHGGVGIILDIMTDNKNRTSSDIRIATNKRGGNVAMPGSVAFNFDRKGVIQILKEGLNEDDLFTLASDVGADDFEVVEDRFIVITPPDELYQVKDKIAAVGIQCEVVGLDMIPKVYVKCDEAMLTSNMALIEWLADLDDVDAVYHNIQA